VAPEPEEPEAKLDGKGLGQERPEVHPLASDQDIRAQLDRAGASWKCPVCEHSAWSIAVHPFALAPIRGGVVVSHEGSPVRALVCDNCRFVRLHAIDTLI
jgi:hypothetical protein